MSEKDRNMASFIYPSNFESYSELSKGYVYILFVLIDKKVHAKIGMSEKEPVKRIIDVIQSYPSDWKFKLWRVYRVETNAFSVEQFIHHCLHSERKKCVMKTSKPKEGATEWFLFESRDSLMRVDGVCHGIFKMLEHGSLLQSNALDFEKKFNNLMNKYNEPLRTLADDIFGPLDLEQRTESIIDSLSTYLTGLWK